MKKQLNKIPKGFTFVGSMIVVTIIGLLSAIALPNYMIARKKAQIKTAQASMKQIESAVEQARLDNVVIDGADEADGGDLVPDYLKEWPNLPGTLDVEFANNANCVTVTIPGINGGNAFTAYEVITPHGNKSIPKKRPGKVHWASSGTGRFSKIKRLTFN